MINIVTQPQYNINRKLRDTRCFYRLKMTHLFLASSNFPMTLEVKLNCLFAPAKKGEFLKNRTPSKQFVGKTFICKNPSKKFVMFNFDLRERRMNFFFASFFPKLHLFHFYSVKNCK